MDINKLAVLVNLAESDINYLSNDLQVDADLIERALTFGVDGLDRNERLELTERLANYERTQLDETEQTTLESYTNSLDEIESYIDDFRNGDILRDAVINDKITLDDLDNVALLFGQGAATMAIQNTLIDWLNENENANAKTFLDLFAQDDYRLDELQDSAFWEWFRDTFYND